jgi:hypothetical protein
MAIDMDNIVPDLKIMLRTSRATTIHIIMAATVLTCNSLPLLHLICMVVIVKALFLPLGLSRRMTSSGTSRLGAWFF